MVLCFHLMPHFALSPYLSIINDWTQWGFAGVDVFFAISGFVVYRSAKAAVAQRGMVNFCWRRFARIYFGYWPVFILATIIWSLWLHREMPDSGYMLRSLLLLSPSLSDNWIPTAWSLTFELWFYLWTAVIVFWTKRPLRAVIGLMTVIVLWNTGWLAFDRSGVYAGQQVLRFPMTGLGVEFLAGALIAELHEHHRELFSNFSSAAPLAGILMCIGLTTGTVAPWFDRVELLRAGTFGLFGTASLILVLALSETSWTPPRFLVKTGDASYSLYLLHPLLIDCSSYFRNMVVTHVPGLLTGFLVALPIAIVLASIIWYEVVERPGVLLARRIFHSRRSPLGTQI